MAVVRQKDSLLKSLPPAEDYLSKLDLEAVAQAILGPDGTPKMAEYDLRDAKAMIWAAAEKFLTRDLYDLEITGVEEPYEQEITFPWGKQVFRGIKDLTGVLRGRLNVTKHLAGKNVVIDWKTTHNTLSTEWDERLMDSWQWKKYLHFGKADAMLYRGISRGEEIKTRELLIERPPNLEQEVLEQLGGVSLARNTLITAGLEVWPRRMPGSCGAFGRECSRFTDCRLGTMPRGVPEKDSPLSYSSMELFLLCPEKYRRAKLDQGHEDTEESLYGQAYHRGIAELYSQAWKLFQ